VPRTSSSSTPVRSGRTPTTGSTGPSVSSGKSRTPIRECRSPWAAAWHRRTRRRWSPALRGSTSSSAPTT
ncbi:hypothetical protein KR044_004805, partial [Drosophila immigrans]